MVNIELIFDVLLIIEIETGKITCIIQPTTEICMKTKLSVYYVDVLWSQIERNITLNIYIYFDSIRSFDSIYGCLHLVSDSFLYRLVRGQSLTKCHAYVL